MTKFRTHNCSELTEKDVGKNIKLSGWLHRKRDHGNLLFIDLRDHFGLTQCVIENNNKFFSTLEKIKMVVNAIFFCLFAFSFWKYIQSFTCEDEKRNMLASYEFFFVFFV